MTVDQINDEWFAVVNGAAVAGPFSTHETAWRWVDQHLGEPTSGGRTAKFSATFTREGVKDLIALDLKQIDLIIRIEMLDALQRALPQIEAVLRKIYSDTDQKEIPD